jgi:hypothetical protein
MARIEFDPELPVIVLEVSGSLSIENVRTR